jgi:hypothetical protein
MVAACNLFVLLLLDFTWSGCAIKHRGRGKGKHRDPADGPIVNLSPEERKQRHDEEFQEFEVNISMKRAHETGLRLGIVFDSFNDWEAPEIVSMRKPSLLEEWNKEHPDSAVHLHDRVVRVNHIQFHHNANAFIERIVGQFTAGRKMLDGAREVMTLQIQRERVQQSQTRFAYQREDLHDKLYSKEFNVPLVVPEDETSPKTMDSVLGWELNVTKNWDPVSVGKIVEGGLLAQWNEAHPDDMILVGDEILHVNKRHWLRNTTLFLNHLAFNYEHRAALQANASFALGLRRPRWVQEAYDANQVLRAEEAAKAAELAAKEAKAKAKFEDDLLRVAPDIADAVRYWNRVFPHDQITPTNRSMADAVKALQAEGWDYSSSGTSLPKGLDAADESSASAQARKSSDATGGLDESDYLVEMAKKAAMQKADAALRLAAPKAAADQDDSEDASGAEGDSAPKESAAAAEPSAPAEAEKSKDSIADQDESVDEGDSAPKESAAAAEPSAPAEAEKSSDAAADQDESEDASGAEGDSAPKESADAAEPSAPAEAEQSGDLTHDKDEAKDVIGAEEDEMVLGDEA